MTTRRPCRHLGGQLVGCHGDRGSGTLWVLAGVVVLLLATTAVIGVGAAVVARHRAGSAADLAALAAAERAQRGLPDGCAQAARVAQAAGARLRRCVVTGAVVDVVVDVTVDVAAAGLDHRWGPAVGRARAGPTRP